ncbi:MAG: hypothetical protein PHR06_10295 [Candidatus Cloacimonetes bacterium]|nr:hypothetical protein [Candidatus Cloacimonadota bacterium]
MYSEIVAKKNNSIKKLPCLNGYIKVELIDKKTHFLFDGFTKEIVSLREDSNLLSYASNISEINHFMLFPGCKISTHFDISKIKDKHALYGFNVHSDSNENLTFLVVNEGSYLLESSRIENGVTFMEEIIMPEKFGIEIENIGNKPVKIFREKAEFSCKSGENKVLYSKWQKDDSEDFAIELYLHKVVSDN